MASSTGLLLVLLILFAQMTAHNCHAAPLSLSYNYKTAELATVVAELIVSMPLFASQQRQQDRFTAHTKNRRRMRHHRSERTDVSQGQLGSSLYDHLRKQMTAPSRP
uniref:Uncharacterized protein n=1 Tax=Plectus sambesii TaxID=2011161 RepID=A0A914XDJ7_9BILA